MRLHETGHRFSYAGEKAPAAVAVIIKDQGLAKKILVKGVHAVEPVSQVEQERWVGSFYCREA